MIDRISIFIPKESGNKSSVIKIAKPLYQIEDEIKAQPYDPESMTYLLALCGVVREAHEMGLSAKEIKKDVKTLLEEAGYIPKKAA